MQDCYKYASKTKIWYGCENWLLQSMMLAFVTGKQRSTIIILSGMDKYYIKFKLTSFLMLIFKKLNLLLFPSL